MNCSKHPFQLWITTRAIKRTAISCTSTPWCAQVLLGAVCAMVTVVDREENGKWVLRGVTSWVTSKACPVITYSVYARVVSYVDWVKNKMGKWLLFSIKEAYKRSLSQSLLHA